MAIVSLCDVTSPYIWYKREPSKAEQSGGIITDYVDGESASDRAQFIAH